VREWKKPHNPLSKDAHDLFESIVRQATEQLQNEQLPIRVGERVWARFSDTPPNHVEHGTVIAAEINYYGATYRVLLDDTLDIETFWASNIGDTIFREEDINPT